MDYSTSNPESGGGLAGLLVGFGMLTMALFPLAIPMVALLAVLAIPLVPVAIVGAIVVAVWRGARALAR